MQTRRVQDLFLWSMSFVYLWAFSSLYYQIPGLYGDNGLLPIKNLVQCKGKPADCALFGDKPSGLHFILKWTGLNEYQTMEVATLLGVTLASLSIVFGCFRDTVVYGLLWYLYFSCFQVGQTFLWFQWDTLLLEAGFLTILVAPLRILRRKQTQTLPHDRLSLFLVRWLTFRMMFASGVVKLTSECPTWWSLTALNYHFESQCIPTSLAWWAHQSPEWLRKFSVAITYLVEIMIPPLFLAPVKKLRVFAFWTQILFMISIMLTGNYNFFNIIYCVICIPLLVDSSDSQLGAHVVEKRLGSVYNWIRSVVVGGAIGALGYYFIHFFKVDLVKSTNGVAGWAISSQVGFEKADLYRFLASAVPLFIVAGTICFLSEVLAAMCRCWIDFRSKFCWLELWTTLQGAVMCGICAGMFAISLVPFSWLDQGGNMMLWPEIKEAYSASEKYQLTHSYGLFRSMTGVGGRPEVVIEGSDTAEGPWKEYSFLYKPGDLNRPPPFIIPHQPRLDWQMWFAALGSYKQNPWFLSLAHKLLVASPSVLRLMDRAGNPFPQKPPKYIRAQLYHYHFTSHNSAKKETKAWWSRELKGEYLPVVDLTNPSLTEYLENNGLIIKVTKKASKPGPAEKYLTEGRKLAELVDGPEFVWGVSGAVLFVALGKRVLLG